MPHETKSNEKPSTSCEAVSILRQNGNAEAIADGFVEDSRLISDMGFTAKESGDYQLAVKDFDEAISHISSELRVRPSKSEVTAFKASANSDETCKLIV